MQELDYQRKLNEVVRANGGYARKWATRFAVGVPDCIWVLRGASIFVEVKLIPDAPSFKRKANVSAKQMHELLALEKAGANAFVAVVVAGGARPARVGFYRPEPAGVIVSSSDTFVPVKHTLLHPVICRVFSTEDGPDDRQLDLFEWADNAQNGGASA